MCVYQRLLFYLVLCFIIGFWFFKLLFWREVLWLYCVQFKGDLFKYLFIMVKRQSRIGVGSFNFCKRGIGIIQFGCFFVVYFRRRIFFLFYKFLFLCQLELCKCWSQGGLILVLGCGQVLCNLMGDFFFLEVCIFVRQEV